MRAISNAIYKLANANENKIYPNVGSNGLPARMDGRKVGLSWRVYILPFLGEQKLYAAFNHNEPWDGPNNKKLIERMPDVFRAPDVTGTGKTSIHVFVSKPGNYRRPRLSGRHPSPFREFEKGDKQARGRRARDIRDGFYNTLMFVKAGPDKADIWTKPTGIPFDSHENPLESLGTIPREGFWVAFFDGVVGQIKPTISLDLLKKLIQYDDFTTPERIENIPGIVRPPRKKTEDDPQTTVENKVSPVLADGPKIVEDRKIKATPENLPALSQEQAVSAIKELGGFVRFYEKSPTSPVKEVYLSAVSQLTDAGLVLLKGLTELQSLDLSITEVTDAGLVHLKGLTELQSLNLWGTNVIGTGLVHLKGLTELQSLHLNANEVSDAGLVHLKGLTKLQSLHLRNTHVTTAGMRKLKRALPNCKIEWLEFQRGP
jgi:hypothetical protein